MAAWTRYGSATASRPSPGWSLWLPWLPSPPVPAGYALGTAVLLMALRHPVLLAQTLGTVDLISGGRLMIAAGVGGAFNDEQQREWEAAGVFASRRASRLEEMIQIIKGLGKEEPVTFEGKHFNLDSVAIRPLPVQTQGIPIFLACHCGQGARVAVSARRPFGRRYYFDLRHPGRVRSSRRKRVRPGCRPGPRPGTPGTGDVPDGQYG